MVPLLIFIILKQFFEQKDQENCEEETF